MSEISVVGLDLAKSVFQVHGVDAAGRTVARKKLRRSEVLAWFSARTPCLVGMEACATAHFWGRELSKLGHEVRLMPPAYVKPYVKRGKTDAADAEAIAEAVTRPTMRYVPIKTAEQQAVLTQHKMRDLLVRQKTMAINALRGHLAEFGLVSPKGLGGVRQLVETFHDEQEELPALARAAIHAAIDQLREIERAIEKADRRILAFHRSSELSRRLATIPGVGPIIATALAASVPDPSMFRNGRQFAAWLGLTPRAHESGSTKRKLGISKQGDSYLRRLLVTGATALLRGQVRTDERKACAQRLLEAKPARVVTVAIANKTARIAWALMMRKRWLRPTAQAS